MKITVDFLAYEGTPTNDPQDATAIKRKVEEANVNEVSRHQIILPVGTADKEIDMPTDGATYLMIFSDQEISIKINGGSEPIVMTPKTVGQKCPVLMIRSDIDSLLITNNASSDANIDMIAVDV